MTIPTRAGNDLIVVGDEAWTPEEWEARQRELARDREYARRKRESDRDRYNARIRDWYARNREHRRAYMREWMRQYRARRAA